MSQAKRILIGLAVLVFIGGGVLALEYFRGRAVLLPAAGQVTLTPGSVPIYLDGTLAAGFAPDSLQTLELVSFIDAEDGKSQDGWLLRDVLLIYLPEESLVPGTLITISSSTRDKAIELTWEEVNTLESMVMFDLSNRGTLKLVSLLDRLNTRDEWVQDVDRIEVVNP